MRKQKSKRVFLHHPPRPWLSIEVTGYIHTFLSRLSFNLSVSVYLNLGSRDTIQTRAWLRHVLALPTCYSFPVPSAELIFTDILFQGCQSQFSKSSQPPSGSFQPETKDYLLNEPQSILSKASLTINPPNHASVVRSSHPSPTVLILGQIDHLSGIMAASPTRSVRFCSDATSISPPSPSTSSHSNKSTGSPTSSRPVHPTFLVSPRVPSQLGSRLGKDDFGYRARPTFTHRLSRSLSRLRSSSSSSVGHSNSSDH